MSLICQLPVILGLVPGDLIVARHDTHYINFLEISSGRAEIVNVEQPLYLMYLKTLEIQFDTISVGSQCLVGDRIVFMCETNMSEIRKIYKKVEV